MEGPGGFAAGRRGMDRRTLMKRTLMAAGGLVLAPPAGAWAPMQVGQFPGGPLRGDRSPARALTDTGRSGRAFLNLSMTPIRMRWISPSGIRSTGRRHGVTST